MSVSSIIVLALVATLAMPSLAQAADVHPNWYSQQASPSHASAGASVEASSQTPGAPGGRDARPALNGTPAEAAPQVGGSSTLGTPTQEVAYPTISSNSALLHNPHPFGKESFWYTAEGHRCLYEPTSDGACFTVVAAAKEGTAGAPAIDPAAIAAAAAARLNLQAGTIAASPSASQAGLTGAVSWFWLSPTVQARTISVSLAGERVIVSAAPQSVQWSFGDGSSLTGGAGVPYQSGPAPAGAMRHVYEVRCLPGDQGHDPRVLASCGPDGYPVTATVVWAISYRASGPVAGGGALPARSTAVSIVYPVSESRAFLASSSEGGS